MRLLYVLIFALVVLVFYLSWIPNPRLNDVWFIPGWLARWTDTPANEDIRTAVPFVFLGLCTGVLLPTPGRSYYRWFIAWLLLVGVVALAEAGQLLLPRRAFRLADIAWGAVGALVGMLAAFALISLKNRFKA
ncbi:VanZ family protein [Spirosoma agri]|uniref:VanZ family protein n=1 Tax=Spirosoma agri TaxID=1987381 RepID=A0A6M0INI2_9BACT|nr:VanZ family protein [Spirosoma agri]NEU69876.1 hypothetical protein [Spirosoma agri]